MQVRAAGLKNHDTMTEQLYLLQCGDKMKSWKAWQRTLFDEARRFDRQLFTKAQIAVLGTHLNHIGHTCRNYTGITMPDWDFCQNYAVRPQISLGYGCSVTFTPVVGYFTGR